jgi:hypothetical protein
MPYSQTAWHILNVQVGADCLQKKLKMFKPDFGKTKQFYQNGGCGSKYYLACKMMIIGPPDFR